MARFDNRSILYIHGFESSSQSKKASMLKTLCPNNRLIIPDLVENPQQALMDLDDYLATASKETMIIGASLGGFYAYYLAAKYQRACLLINPVMVPSHHGLKILKEQGAQDPARKKEIERVLLQYKNMELTLENFTPPKQCFIAYGNEDTVVPMQTYRDFFTNRPHLSAIYHDDHRLITHFEVALSDFETYLYDESTLF